MISLPIKWDKLKKNAPYILSGLLLAAIIFFLVVGGNRSSHRFDDRITLHKRDKIPYGTYVAYQNLHYLFPKAGIYSSRREPGFWDSLSTYDGGQALIIIARQFQASEMEMRRIVTFARHGNDVFICARYISAAADAILGCSSSSLDLTRYSDAAMRDSLRLSLSGSYFGDTTEYFYPGKTFLSYFESIDSSTTEVLGYTERGHANFIHLRTGRGNVYVHLEPLAFSNYFLLHKNNMDYYDKALSLINPEVSRLVWDEYYMNKKGPSTDNSPSRSSNWLGVLFNHPALRAALLVLIFLLLLYVLLEMRRKQRYIPVITAPKNDSLDFVKTVGRLYYDKGDHRNLCRKMGAYFMEYVRNRYKLATGMLDEDFIKNLKFKSGVEEEEIRKIVLFIKYTEEASSIDQKQLTGFYRQLESFYSKA